MTNAFKFDVGVKFDPKNLKALFGSAVEHGLRVAADRLLADARAYVPVLTGALKDSGVVIEQPTFDAAVKSLNIVFNTAYARTQHEDPYWHPSLGFYGAAKYLTRPLELFGEFYVRLIDFETRRYLEQGGRV